MSLAKDKLAKVAEDVKASGKEFLFITMKKWSIILAQNFADDAIKAAEQYAKDGAKRGEKLRDDAIELGKEKG